MRGAIREDDGGIFAGSWVAEEKEPLDDAFGNFNRFCKHFFDPLHNRALTDPHAWPICPAQDASATAPTWASGALDPFASPALAREDTTRRNHFSLTDAREAMWRALTGWDKTLQTQVAATGIERKAYWATTFRALGDVLHLNQDMAQPQHTRNESHGTSHASDYEKYIDARAKGASSVTLGGFLNGQMVVATRPLAGIDYSGYPIPRFAHYSKYWSTAPGQGSLSGRGLADYSSRGFFTPAANIGNADYPAPNPDPAAYTYQIYTFPNGNRAAYLTGTVYDAYAKSASSPMRMARKSVLHDPLNAAGVLMPGPLYVLDPAIYDERAALLLPRAVAYSAGLLDYFFNGRLRISLPEEGAYAVADHASANGFTAVRLKLTNATPPLQDDGSSLPQHLYNGTAVAIVKYHRNTCYRADLAGEYGSPAKSPLSCRDNSRSSAIPLDIDDTDETIVVSRPIPLSLDAGATRALAFDFAASPIPFGVSDVYLQVAYRGAVGPDTTSAEQDVVIVGTKDISEPTYFTYFNASDYIHIGSHVYTRAQVTASQTLIEQVQPRSCLTGTLGNRQLSASCLTPFALTMQLSFGALTNPAVRVDGLPSRRFFRFAVLTDPAAVLTKSLSSSSNASRAAWRITTSTSPGIAGDLRKSLLYQQSTCLPLDAFDVPSVEHQLRFDTDPPNYHFDSLSALRGIPGYFYTSCVLNGDGSVPGAPDDRNVVMTSLDGTAGETLPFKVVVNPAFAAP